MRRVLTHPRSKRAILTLESCLKLSWRYTISAGDYLSSFRGYRRFEFDDYNLHLAALTSGALLIHYPHLSGALKCHMKQLP